MPRWLDAAAGDVQVRAGHRVHRRAEGAAQARPGPHGAGPVPSARRAASRSARGTSVAACLPDPAGLGERMQRQDLRRAVGHRHRQGRPAAREVYLYHVVDNAWSMAEYGAQCVVWQTAVNPVVALELLATGVWRAPAVLGPGGVRRRAVPGPARRLRRRRGACRSARRPPDQPRDRAPASHRRAHAGAVLDAVRGLARTPAMQATARAAREP